MEQSKIDNFLLINGKFFKPEQLENIKTILTNADDNIATSISAIEFKDPTTMLIISILVGGIGVDRFMLGETGLGVAKLLTAGGCGIWSIIDWFSIQDRTREYNYNLFCSIVENR